MMNEIEIKRAQQIKECRFYTIDDIPLLTRVFEQTYFAEGTEWDYFARSSLQLPDWFDTKLSPDSQVYAEQQLRLWRTISGREREYEPETDEKEVSLPDVDPVRFPGYYRYRGASAVDQASNHIIATGLILKHSKLKPGDWALEYGAGFGQIALAFTRLGVNVDTVDISSVFCEYVKANANFYETNLTPHKGKFGDMPRGPSHKYDMIYFFEAFHHSLNFHELIGRLKRALTPNGKILLCGEPIWRNPTAAIPYEWGLRLDAETVVVTRSRGWMELGHGAEYLCALFHKHGFKSSYYECPTTNLGHLYVFEHCAESDPNSKIIDLASYQFPPIEAETWHTIQPNGRWTKEYSIIPLEQPAEFSDAHIYVCNHLPVEKDLTIAHGGRSSTYNLSPGQSLRIHIERDIKASKIALLSSVHSPHELTNGTSSDKRLLGVFVQKILFTKEPS
ncbi:class I SAM-dependent methyltransferase [Azospirillum baldaniorum]|uniref:class I SAM-dependent methyltransferase n=1 Tax=Azospirillum baldaniorum TaxID=1064539 RepID=UPI00157B8629|nr:class I SAM-dependent methyltransferase [Azospirillum baldaniorum]